MKRTTAVALAASATLVVLTGAVAASAVLGLPVLGFGSSDPGSAKAAPTTTPPPSVVDQTVYDDHYVTAPSGGATVRPSRVAATPTAGAPVSGIGSAVGNATASAAPTPTTAAAAPTTVPPPTTPPTTVTTRPAPPPGCREPEWDPEHHVWQCSVGN